jgi:hypothetical protein
MKSYDQQTTEKFCLLGYNAVKSVDSQPIFRRNISPPFSGSKNKPSKNPVWNRLAYSSTLKMDATLLRNVSWHSAYYMVFYPRRLNSSFRCYAVGPLSWASTFLTSTTCHPCRSPPLLVQYSQLCRGCLLHPQLEDAPCRGDGIHFTYVKLNDALKDKKEGILKPIGKEIQRNTGWSLVLRKVTPYGWRIVYDSVKELMINNLCFLILFYWKGCECTEVQKRKFGMEIGV